MSDVKTINDLLGVIDGDLDSYHMLAAFTDEYKVVGNVALFVEELTKNEYKAIDIRLFNTEREYRLFRDGIGKEFVYKKLDDARLKSEGYDLFDENQFLDIDTIQSSKSEKGQLITTGGGKYDRPKTIGDINTAKVKIRYYLKQDEKSGQAKVVDWRVVEFV